VQTTDDPRNIRNKEGNKHELQRQAFLKALEKPQAFSVYRPLVAAESLEDALHVGEDKETVKRFRKQGTIVEKNLKAAWPNTIKRIELLDSPQPVPSFAVTLAAITPAPSPAAQTHRPRIRYPTSTFIVSAAANAVHEPTVLHRNRGR